MFDEGGETLSGYLQTEGPQLQPGEVFAERYTIHRLVARGAYTREYHAIDRATEAEVLLRLLTSGWVRTQIEGERCLAKLTAAVGVGGLYLPGLITAAQHRGRLYVVEPWRAAVCLRDVFMTRQTERRTFSARELLPVAARLAAALDALPLPWRHGDVRAENVWIDSHHLNLCGPFLLAALPPRAVMSLANDSTAADALAPEVRHGLATTASDRWGVASIVFEGLFGRLPPRDVRSALDADDGPRPVTDALNALLDPVPNNRSTSLNALLEALAEVAGLPVPALPPHAFRRRPSGPPGVDEPLTRRGPSPHSVATVGAYLTPAFQRTLPVWPPADPPQDEPSLVPESRDSTTTEPVRRSTRSSPPPPPPEDTFITAPGKRATGSEPPPVSDDRTPPTGEQRKSTPTPPPAPRPSLDPELVQAALSSPKDDRLPAHHRAPRTHILRTEDIEVVQTVDPRGPPRPRHPLGVGVFRRGPRSGRVGPSPAASTAPDRVEWPPERTYDHADWIPAAAHPPGDAEPRPQDEMPPDAEPEPAPTAAPPPRGALALSLAWPRTLGTRRPRTRRNQQLGRWIVVGASLLAVIIVAGSILLAMQRRDQAQRERRLQQRFQLLQQQQSLTPRP